MSPAIEARQPAPWPPPPDLESIQDLVRSADIEGLIADGAPADEYEPEEEQILSAIQHLSTARLTTPNLLPILESIWRKNFSDDDAELAMRLPALESLARQIARFFGPEAQPQTRESR
jgi:hypothetical protein